jgi:hypothetical protein
MTRKVKVPKLPESWSTELNQRGKVAGLPIMEHDQLTTWVFKSYVFIQITSDIGPQLEQSDKNSAKNDNPDKLKVLELCEETN